MRNRRFCGIKIRTSISGTLLLAATITLLIAPSASDAQQHGHLYLVPFVFDPDNSGQSTARFFSKGHTIVLHLTKVGPTNSPNVPDGVESGAKILGAIPLHITQIGFDIGPGSQCGGGAPRFNIHDNTGNYWFFVCDHMKEAPGAKVTTLPNGYVRISCDPSLVPDSTGTTTEPFTHETVVTALNLAFDVGTDFGTGFADLANVTVNNQVCIPHYAPH